MIWPQRECQLPKLNVEGSSPFARSMLSVCGWRSYARRKEWVIVAGMSRCPVCAIFVRPPSAAFRDICD